jgi:hypothetical protein
MNGYSSGIIILMGETACSKINVPYSHVAHHTSSIDWAVIVSGFPRQKAGIYSISYGMDKVSG